MGTMGRGVGGFDAWTRCRRWLRPAALLLAISTGFAQFAVPASAAGPLEIESVGWDGSVAWGTWAPVRVRVAGSRSDATAHVEVVLFQRTQPSAQNGPAVAAYGQDVPLPAGVTKEVTLWAPV